MYSLIDIDLNESVVKVECGIHLRVQHKLLRLLGGRKSLATEVGWVLSL